MNGEGGFLRVLIVHDNATFLDTTANALLSEGFDVVSAQTRGDAIDHVNRGFLPTVVILGTPPGIDIGEFVDAMRRLSPAICFVFLAGNLASATGLGRHRRSAVIIRPFDTVDLIRAVRTMAQLPTDPTTRRPPHADRLGGVDASNVPIGFLRFVWPWVAALILVALAWLVTDLLARSVTR